VQSPYVPNIGDVVIIKDNIPRGMWRLGRLVQLITSNDGQIRSAKVKMSSGNIISRPLKLLYPLEVEDKTDIKVENKSSEVETAETRPIRKSAENAKRKSFTKLRT